MTRALGSKRSKLAVGLLLLAGALAPAPAHAASDPALGSRVIPYTGELSFGSDPFDGPIDLTFHIYDDPVAGQELHTELFTDVQVASGRFTVLLGGDADLEADLLGASVLYIGVSVDDGGGAIDLLPRQRVGSAPFAYRGAPGADFVVDGELRFGGKCIDSGTTAVNIITVNGVFSSATIGFARVFDGGPPTVTATPRCASTCGSFRAQGMKIETINSSSFTLSWYNTATGAVIDQIHWVAIGPCN